MLRIFVAMLVVFYACGCAAQYGSSQKLQKQPLASPSQSATNMKSDSSALDGIYEFVSEVTNVTAPSQRNEQSTAAEWEGLWIFHNGHFSQTFAKKQRTDWTPSHFPNDPRKLGFDAASGVYKIEGNTVQLDYLLTFYPGKAGKREILTYDSDGKTMTLAEELTPTREYAATGQRVLVLRKVN